MMEFISKLLLSFILLGFISLSFLIGLYLGIATNNIYSRDAPSNYLNRSDIIIYSDKVCLNISNASVSNYADSGSMKNTLDENSNGIWIEITSPNDVHIGDIVSYSKGNDTIIHRVIGIENKSNETFFKLKGDNNNFPDPIVNYSQLKEKTIILVY